MADPGTHDQFVRRRSAAIAVAALVGLAGVAGLVALVSGGDKDSGSTTASETAPPQAIPSVARGRAVANAAIGAAIRRPQGWHGAASADTISLRSDDRTALLAVSSAPGQRSAAEVLRRGVAAVRRAYRNVRPLPGGGGRIAGHEAASIVLAGENSRGTRVRVLVAGVQGRRRAWLVEVFASEGTNRLAQAQLALETLRLSG